MNDFDRVLADAVAAVGESYVRIPVADAFPVIRERAFAYELYHQLRDLAPHTRFTLSGELEKAAHPDLRGSSVRRLAPDLLLHVPGERSGNFAAIEIKGGWPRSAGLRKDMASLCLLRDRFEYMRLIYLVYGLTERQSAKLATQLRTVNAAAERNAKLQRIELWVRHLATPRPSLVPWNT